MHIQLSCQFIKENFRSIFLIISILWRWKNQIPRKFKCLIWWVTEWLNCLWLIFECVRMYVYYNVLSDLYCMSNARNRRWHVVAGIRNSISSFWMYIHMYTLRTLCKHEKWWIEVLVITGTHWKWQSYTMASQLSTPHCR